MRKILCAKLKKEAMGLDFSPYPGELGQKIYESISTEAWEQWLNHQTLLINEYRLNLKESAARHFLQEEMEKFLFSENTSARPEGYLEEI